MGEVSAMFEVNQSMIRFYEKEFDVLQPKKNKKGNRYFTPEDVENLKIIFHLIKATPSMAPKNTLKIIRQIPKTLTR